jgi:glutamate/tyrosine decarboxylase-like PLP-dependent enzyme
MNHQGEKKLAYLKENLFLSPDGSNINNLIEQISIGCASFLNHQGNSPTFPKFKLIEEDLRETKNPKEEIKNLFKYFGGSVKSNHPLLLRNVIPSPNFASLSSKVIASLLMANGVTSEDSGDLLTAESKMIKFFSNLIQIDKKKSTGFFTWGGTATSFYGLKAGLNKVDPNHTSRGVNPKKIAVLSSWTGHYCQNTATSWLGIGENNIIKVKSNFDHTTNLEDLEKKMRNCIKNKKRIATIFCIGGSSANGSIDDIKKIWIIRKKIIKEFSLDYTPHIHVDSVSGWVFLVFQYYNFKKNPFGFDKEVISHLKKILSKVLTLKYGDSYGFDFHKTGYCPYNSTFFLIKNKKDLEFLARDSNKIAPLFHNQESKNSTGFLYTMETSRSSADILSTWIGLKTMGISGLQLLIGHGLENTNFLKKLLSSQKSRKAGFKVINEDLFGTTLHLRFYSGDPIKEHSLELQDKKELEKNNELTKSFFDFINNSKRYSSKVSFSCSRGSFYLSENIKGRGIRIYFLNPYTKKSDVLKAYNLLMEANYEFRKTK